MATTKLFAFLRRNDGAETSITMNVLVRESETFDESNESEVLNYLAANLEQLEKDHIDEVVLHVKQGAQLTYDTNMIVVATGAKVIVNQLDDATFDGAWVG